MKKQKSIKQSIEKFQKTIQRIMDEDNHITSITMQVGDKPPVVIAEKKPKTTCEQSGGKPDSKPVNSG